MTESEIDQILEHAQVVNLQPGDVIILRSPDRLTREQCVVIKYDAQRVFPDHEVIVLTGGLELAVGHHVTADA